MNCFQIDGAVQCIPENLWATFAYIFAASVMYMILAATLTGIVEEHYSTRAGRIIFGLGIAIPIILAIITLFV